METDERVAALDERSRASAEARREAYEWDRLPTWMRANLVVGLVASCASAYVLGLAGSKCFRKFEIQYHLADFASTGLVFPLGWVAFALAGVGWSSVVVLGRFVSCVVRTGPSSSVVDVEPALEAGATVPS